MARAANKLPPGDAPHEYQTFREFGGMERKAIRTSIQKNSFYYLQNLMSLGAGNLRTVRSVLASASITSTIYGVSQWYGNLSNGDWLLVSMSDGSLWAENLSASTPTFTQIADAGTDISDVTTWNTTALLLIGPNGYYYWTGSGDIVPITPADSTILTVTPTVRLNFASVSGGSFSVGETVTQATSGATGVVSYFDNSVTVLYVTTVVGVFDTTNTVTGGTSGANGVPTRIDAVILTLSAATGTFLQGENVSQATSGATGKVALYDATNLLLYITNSAGVFDTSHVVTGAGSGATTTPNAVADGETPFQIGESIAQVGNLTAGGVITAYDPTANTVQLNTVTGTFVTNFPITGVTTQATGQVIAVDTSGPPTAGSYIAVYQGRVWITSERTVSFSGPNDYTAQSWDVALGAGSFTIQDTSLIGNITHLFVANGYLYIFGPTSIDIVSNVYIPAGAVPPLPAFTRTNINATIGTPYPASVTAYDRLIIFVNNFGVWALSGIQVERISEPLDQLFEEVDFDGIGEISCGVGVCNKQLTLLVLVDWFDPAVSASISRQTFLALADKKWFLYDPLNVNPGGTFQGVVSCFIGKVQAAGILYTTQSGSDYTTTEYQALNGTDMPIVRSAQTPLWDLGLSIKTKQAIVFGVEGTMTNPSYAMQATIDSETNQSAPVDMLPLTMEFTNANSQPITFLNANGQPIVWTVVGYFFSFADAQQYGKYLGITAYGTTGDAVLSGFNLEYRRSAEDKWAL